MIINPKRGTLHFGQLELAGWMGYEEVRSNSVNLGYSISAISQNDKWSRFIVMCEEEPFALSLVFADLKLEIIVIYHKDEAKQSEPEDIFQLAKRCGLKDGEYRWGSVTVGYDNKGGSYIIGIRYNLHKKPFWKFWF